MLRGQLKNSLKLINLQHIPVVQRARLTNSLAIEKDRKGIVDALQIVAYSCSPDDDVANGQLTNARQ